MGVGMHAFNRTVAVAAAALFISLSAAGTARAQTPASPVTEPIEQGQWTLTPWAALGVGGDIEDGGFGVGVAAAYNVTPRVALEAGFTLLPSVEQGVLATFDTTYWNLSGNVLYHFAERPFMPYVAAGLGVGYASTDFDGLDPNLIGDFDDNSTELVFNVGGGVKRRFNDRASFRGDIRYFTGDELVTDFLRLYAGVTFDLGQLR